jgi:predicted negative regulator of RcsB-dependent stress response
MATHLDLEEQEQLDQLKHFWNQYGNLITWVLVIVLAPMQPGTAGIGGSARSR